MKRPILLLATSLLIAPAASAEEPQRRPGVIRMPNAAQCNQTTDIYGDYRDRGREIPCDDRYKEGERIAWWEFGYKTKLKVDNSPGNRANWEAWRASATSGAATYEARMEAYFAEQRKQAEQHAEMSKPFLSGRCEPSGMFVKDALENGCRVDKTYFQRGYWLALQGDHWAQNEDVARCFAPGAITRPCNGVVQASETMMCAWYLVAASSGHPESERSARTFASEDCDKKPLHLRQAILGTASELFLRIYQRPMPVAR